MLVFYIWWRRKNKFSSTLLKQALIIITFTILDIVIYKDILRYVCEQELLRTLKASATTFTFPPAVWLAFSGRKNMEPKQRILIVPRASTNICFSRVLKLKTN